MGPSCGETASQASRSSPARSIHSTTSSLSIITLSVSHAASAVSKAAKTLKKSLSRTVTAAKKVMKKSVATLKKGRQPHRLFLIMDLGWGRMVSGQLTKLGSEWIHGMFIASDIDSNSDPEDELNDEDELSMCSDPKCLN
jgi:hypothetical protein